MSEFYLHFHNELVKPGFGFYALPVVEMMKSKLLYRFVFDCHV